jgi:hypothetical protein
MLLPKRGIGLTVVYPPKTRSASNRKLLGHMRHAASGSISALACGAFSAASRYPIVAEATPLAANWPTQTIPWRVVGTICQPAYESLIFLRRHDVIICSTISASRLVIATREHSLLRW